MPDAEQQALHTWKTIEKTTLESNRFLTLKAERRQESGTNRESTFYLVDAPNWTNIVALTADGQMVLVEQFRQASDTIELEVPGGVVDPGESAMDAALRELQEETGFGPTTDTKIQRLGITLPNPAFIRNECSTWLITNVAATSTTKFDEFEETRVRLVTKEAIERLVLTGEIRHSLTLVALYWLRLYEQSGR